MGSFSDIIIEQVWQKAKIVEGYNPDKWRKDFADAWINRDYYGMQIAFGWEVDHLIPVAKGGLDCLENLMPLQWQNNRSKGDNTPKFITTVTSEGNKNIYKQKSWQISKSNR